MPAHATRARLDRRSELDRILQTRGVDVVFQPIVDLESRAVVGYEALARGPAGSPLGSPTALFEAARRAGRESELDWVCRAAAFRAAETAGLPPTMSLLVNVEPRSLGTRCPPDLEPIVTAADHRLQVVLEVTERSLATDPATLLAAIEGVRRSRMGLALDDVGADPASLAMMSLICPDVIKLDLSLIQGKPTPDVARIVNAVLAEAEETGAAIVAEGIESLRHVNVARSMGAQFGQGWLYGRPGPLPADATDPRFAGVATRRLERLPYRSSSVRTPFDAVAGRSTSRATAEVLLPMSMHLEYKGLDTTEPTVLLASFQHQRRFDTPTRDRYRELATRGVLTAVFGVGMPDEPAPGVRGAHVDPDDPLTREWSVIVLGPHFAGALLGRASATGAKRRAGAARGFDYVLTHDRGVAIEAGRALLSRLPAGRSLGT